MRHKNKNKGAIQKQGDLHEESALKRIGGDAENLNNNSKLEGMSLRGGNYPNFDIFSSTEVCSVKSHFTQDGSPNRQTYKNDFSKMLGWGKAYEDGLSPLEQDARRITESATSGVPIPSEIMDANQETVVKYLQEKSVMRIPSDHVDSVREALVSDAKNFPGNYFLPDNPTEVQLQTLSDRVQSTGLTSHETSEQMNTENRNFTERGINLENTHEEVAKTVQETPDGIEESPVADVHQEPSEDEDYHYGYGY